MGKVTLRIIDINFNLLGQINNYESLIFVRKFFGVGDFELHINLQKMNVDKLVEDNLIILSNDMSKVGIIEYVEKYMDENGLETLIVKGSTLKGMVKRKLTIPPTGESYDNATGSQETIIKQFINNNLVNPQDMERKIQNLIIAEDKLQGNSDKWRTRFDKLDEKIQEIAEYSELGWDVLLDITNNKFIFDVIQGKILTTEQDLLPPVIFSVDFNNINNKHFIKNIMNYKNVGYVGGKGDESNRLIQKVGIGTGFARREIFLDCSSAEDATELLTQGNQKIEEFKVLESFEADVISNGSFVYQKDWNLGDIVTVMDKSWDLTMNSRIIEVKEVYEVGGFSLNVIFGTSIPNFITDIKKNNKRGVR